MSRGLHPFSVLPNLKFGNETAEGERAGGQSHPVLALGCTHKSEFCPPCPADVAAAVSRHNEWELWILIGGIIPLNFIFCFVLFICWYSLHCKTPLDIHHNPCRCSLGSVQLSLSFLSSLPGNSTPVVWNYAAQILFPLLCICLSKEKQKSSRVRDRVAIS